MFKSKSKIAGLPAMLGTAVSLLMLSLMLVRAGALANGVVDAKPVIWLESKLMVVRAANEGRSLTEEIELLDKVKVRRDAESGDNAAKMAVVSKILLVERSKTFRDVRPVNQEEDTVKRLLPLKMSSSSPLKVAKPVAIPFILVGVMAEEIMLNFFKVALIGVKAPDVVLCRADSWREYSVIEVAPVKTLSPMVVMPLFWETMVAIVSPVK